MNYEHYTEIKEDRYNLPSEIKTDLPLITSIVDVKVGTRLYLSGWIILTITKIENGGLIYLTDHYIRIPNDLIQKFIDEKRVRNPK